ncbi:hypothetical protein Tco_0422480 [Tanacetum coccineum]
MNTAPHLSQPQISHLSVPPSHQYQSHRDHQTSSVPQIAYHSPQVSIQPMTEFPQMYSGLVVHVFTQGDDPITYLNKAMAFLSAIAALRFPLTNNQLRTSSNPRNHATIQDDRVTISISALSVICVAGLARVFAASMGYGRADICHSGWARRGAQNADSRNVIEGRGEDFRYILPLVAILTLPILFSSCCSRRRPRAPGPSCNDLWAPIPDQRRETNPGTGSSRLWPLAFWGEVRQTLQIRAGRTPVAS